MQHDTAPGNFYKVQHSEQYKANDRYASLCRNCVGELFDTYARRHGSEKTACILLCHLLDIPFYHSLFDSLVANNNGFSMGLYLRQINGRQYQGKDFGHTLLTRELDKTPAVVQGEKEDRWTAEDRTNKDTVIGIVGYDPFEGFNDADRRFLFADLLKYLDDDAAEDPFLLSQIIQIANNNNQVRQYDLRISNLDPVQDSAVIKDLNEMKAKLVSSTDRIAKENEVSLRNRSNKEAGRGTLTGLMKQMREKGLREIEVNYYDQLRAPSTRWAANMSMKALRENAFFDDNDTREVFDTQRELIATLQEELAEVKEKRRLALVELAALKAGEADGEAEELCKPYKT